MVINLGTNDQYFIFRGQDGRDFMRGLSFINHVDMKVVLPDGRRVNARLSITHAKTLCLALPCDDLADDMARLVFDLTLDKFISERMQRHARS
jgi:hypothetical protein